MKVFLTPELSNLVLKHKTFQIQDFQFASSESLRRDFDINSGHHAPQSSTFIFVFPLTVTLTSTSVDSYTAGLTDGSIQPLDKTSGSLDMMIM